MKSIIGVYDVSSGDEVWPDRGENMRQGTYVLHIDGCLFVESSVLQNTYFELVRISVDLKDT